MHAQCRYAKELRAKDRRTKDQRTKDLPVSSGTLSPTGELVPSTCPAGDRALGDRFAHRAGRGISAPRCSRRVVLFRSIEGTPGAAEFLTQVSTPPARILLDLFASWNNVAKRDSIDQG